ncbi:MAG: 5'-Nucleotidase protein [uncultured bacterium]|nr:MAG: 5'-Nucleotidase protein [uncultured bacterium]HBH18909.1 hypothetical protein [Cyanobacteria bacterium UBA9579]
MINNTNKPNTRKYWHNFIVFFITFLVIVGTNNFCLADKEHNLTILHTNDVHGRLLPMDYSDELLSIGGIARRATVIKTIREQNQNTLLLDAGDAIQGSLFFKFYNGIPDVKLMSKMGYDAATLGNHEFDKGIDELAKVVNTAKFPYLSANIRFPKNKVLDRKVKDYAIKKYKGLKVGIIGITTDDLKTLTSDTSDIKILDDIQTAKKLVKKLNNKVDFIVVLSHIGLQDDIELAKQVPEIDVIVGGHTHTFLNKPIAVLNEESITLIVQTGELGIALGRLDLVIKDKKIEKYNYKLLAIDKKIEEDESIAKELSILTQEIESKTSKVVGVLNSSIDARKDKVRTNLTEAGSLVTEAIKSKYPDIEIVMQNSGGIRAHKYINSGPITLGDIIELYPFDNTVVLAEISGQDIKSILETSAKDLPDSTGAFLQTKGLDYTIDLSQNPQKLSDDRTKIINEGNRISNIKVNGISVDEKKYYKIAVNDFIFGGGDGFSQFNSAKDVQKTNVLLLSTIIEYIEQNSPISLTVKDKINLLDYNKIRK